MRRLALKQILNSLSRDLANKSLKELIHNQRNPNTS